MTTNEPPSYPGDSDPGATPPPSGSGESPTSDLPSYGSVPPPEGGFPPPPPPPSHAPGGSAEGFSAPDAIGWGWRKFTENVGPVIIAGLIVVVPYLLVVFFGGRMTAGSFIGSLIISIIGWLILIVGIAIIARGALDVVSGGPFDFGAALGKINVGNVIVTSLIVGVLTAIGTLLLVIPGIIVAFLTFFAVFYVVDENASPIQAIGDSVKLVSANVGDSLLLALLNILILIAGGIALGVGLVVAYPLVILASAYAYRRFRGQPVTA